MSEVARLSGTASQTTSTQRLGLAEFCVEIARAVKNVGSTS